MALADLTSDPLDGSELLDGSLADAPEDSGEDAGPPNDLASDSPDDGLIPVPDLAAQSGSTGGELQDADPQDSDEAPDGRHPIQIVCTRPYWLPEGDQATSGDPVADGDAPVFSILPYIDGEFDGFDYFPPGDDLGDDGSGDDGSGDDGSGDWTDDGSGDGTDDGWTDEDWSDWSDDDGSGDDDTPVDDTSGEDDSGGGDFIAIDWSLEMGYPICILLPPVMLDVVLE